MIEEQKIINVEALNLVKKAEEFYNSGYRLAQICCTALAEGLEINYSFGKDYHFVSLRLNLASADTGIPSISRIYWNAFLYENEMHDLFGINVRGMAVDYKGNFYHTAVKTPFSRKEEKRG